MSVPGPTRPIEVQLGDVAESIHVAFNRAMHDSWQEGYAQAQADALNSSTDE